MPSQISRAPPPFEKSLLVGLERTPGLRTDEEIRHFQRITQRHYGRFAFPDDLNPALGELRKRLRDKKGKDSFEGRANDAVEEIRLAALPDWGAASIDVDGFFLLESTQAMLQIEAEAVSDCATELFPDVSAYNTAGAKSA